MNSVFLIELAVLFLVVDAAIFRSNGNDPWGEWVSPVRACAAATNGHHGCQTEFRSWLSVRSLDSGWSICVIYKDSQVISMY